MPPSRGHFEKNCRHYRKDKGGVDNIEPKKISDNKTTSAIATSEELLFISEQNQVNLTGNESTCVVDSSVSFHLIPNRECFSSYTTGDYDYVKLGNDGACKIVRIGDICLLASMGYIKMGNDG